MLTLRMVKICTFFFPLADIYILTCFQDLRDPSLNNQEEGQFSFGKTNWKFQLVQNKVIATILFFLNLSPMLYAYQQCPT